MRLSQLNTHGAFYAAMGAGVAGLAAIAQPIASAAGALSKAGVSPLAIAVAFVIVALALIIAGLSKSPAETLSGAGTPAPESSSPADAPGLESLLVSKINLLMLFSLGGQLAGKVFAGVTQLATGVPVSVSDTFTLGADLVTISGQIRVAPGSPAPSPLAAFGVPDLGSMGHLNGLEVLAVGTEFAMGIGSVAGQLAAGQSVPLPVVRFTVGGVKYELDATVSVAPKAPVPKAA